jgi:hypothetical protein
MATPVPRQENHFPIVKQTLDELVRRLAERSLDFQLTNFCEARHLVKPAAADHA